MKKHFFSTLNWKSCTKGSDRQIFWKLPGKGNKRSMINKRTFDHISIANLWKFQLKWLQFLTYQNISFQDFPATICSVLEKNSPATFSVISIQPFSLPFPLWAVCWPSSIKGQIHFSLQCRNYNEVSCQTPILQLPLCG